MAQMIDVFQTTAGPAAALAEVTQRTGTWFDPALARACTAVALRDVY